MAAGLPCVTTRWDGASEVIEEDTNGFVLDDPGDVPALADRVQRLRDPTVRRRLGDAARVAAEGLSMARHAREIVSLYNETLSQTGSRS